MLGIMDGSGNAVVSYAYNAWGVLLACTGTMADTLGTLNPLRYRGYVYDTETALYYLQSRYYNPEWGRFINSDVYAATGQGFVGNNMFAYCGNNPVSRREVSGQFWISLIDPLLHLMNNIGIALGIDTAAAGAPLLMMEPDDGIYHASFDCWQQYAGYHESYDYAFDIGTSMKSEQFVFSVFNQDYTIWVWKGDYINLGAGAEMGIYRGSSGHRIVDKNLAMLMGVSLAYNYKSILEYYDTHWWITGFNPEYVNVSAEDLTASFLIRFKNRVMYLAFKNKYDPTDPRWTFYDNGHTAVLLF